MHARSSPLSAFQRSASFVSDTPTMPHPQYLSRDEYVDSRNVQDEQINVALREMRGNITDVKKDVKTTSIIVDKLQVKTDVMQSDIEVLKTDVKGLRTDVEELKGETARITAFLRNSHLRNPLLPIRPISTYHPLKGTVYPELFPKNAHEFYALKNATTADQWRMLDYLATFYEYSRHNDEEEVDCEVIVEFLEEILGLYEPNFESFKQRAKELRARYTYQPVKRPQQDPADHQAQRPRTSYLPTFRMRGDGDLVDENGKVIRDESSSPVSKETTIGWRNPSITTSGRERMEKAWDAIKEGRRANENQMEAESESSKTGESTNANTDKRGPSSEGTNVNTEQRGPGSDGSKANMEKGGPGSDISIPER